ncbi:MAG: HNH endonuclease [Desulfobacteraceae bacterium]|nr:HNH endonuclease [Desulfobacteraceae bacterium]
MTTYLTSELRKRLQDADNRHCAYCHTSESNTGQPMTVDHIIPKSREGPTIFENLCFACRNCNEYKGSQTTAHDPLTGETVPLFHPRRYDWHEHFSWDESGAYIVGLTATGRATVVALNMNNSVIVAVRHRWISVGWHPPDGNMPV